MRNNTVIADLRMIQSWSAAKNFSALLPSVSSHLLLRISHPPSPGAPVIKQQQRRSMYSFFSTNCQDATWFIVITCNFHIYDSIRQDTAFPFQPTHLISRSITASYPSIIHALKLKHFSHLSHT